MIYATATLLLLMLIFGPQLWVKYIFKKYSTNAEWLAGTGGQFAEYLAEKLPLENIRIEEGEQHENYYNPEDHLLKLSETNFNGRSLTAVTVAAHEIGHAIQHKANYQPLHIRTKLAKINQKIEKVAAMLLITFPFVSLLTHTPAAGVLMLLCGITILLLPVLFHLFTLTVEWDASFNRALPLLIAGQYIPEPAIPIAKQILTAAALTYLSASLASVLNFYRWLVFLKR